MTTTDLLQLLLIFLGCFAVGIVSTFLLGSHVARLIRRLRGLLK